MFHIRLPSGAIAEHVVKVAKDVTAVPARPRGDRIAVCFDAFRPVIVGSQCEVQIAVEPGQHFLQVTCAGVDIGARIVEIRKPVDAEMIGRGWPEDLHDAVCIGLGSRRGLEIAFAARDGE